MNTTKHCRPFLAGFYHVNFECRCLSLLSTKRSPCDFLPSVISAVSYPSVYVMGIQTRRVGFASRRCERATGYMWHASARQIYDTGRSVATQLLVSVSIRLGCGDRSYPPGGGELEVLHHTSPGCEDSEWIYPPL